MSQNLISYSVDNPYKIPDNGKMISRVCGTSYKWRWTFAPNGFTLDLYCVSRRYRKICDPVLCLEFQEVSDGHELIIRPAWRSLRIYEEIGNSATSILKRIARYSSIIVDGKFIGYDCDIIAVATGAITLMAMDFKYSTLFDRD